MTPIPSSVQATGIWVFSAKARRSSQAWAWRTPCPARMTGRLAAAISAAASLSWRPWPSRLGRKPGSPGHHLGLGRVRGRVSCWRASLVMSMWTGPGRPVRDVERLGHDARQVVRVADQVVVLGHRQGDAVDVDLLEGILADQRAGHVAGDRDHRHRIEERRADAGDQVRRPRSRGSHAHADPAGDPGVAVGRVGAALLVANQHVAQLGIVAQHVVERQDHPARVAEEDVHALPQERLAQHVGPDPGSLELATLVEHLLAGALDGGRVGGPVVGHVAAPLRRRGRQPTGTWRVSRVSLGDRHGARGPPWRVDR